MHELLRGDVVGFETGMWLVIKADSEGVELLRAPGEKRRVPKEDFFMIVYMCPVVDWVESQMICQPMPEEQYP